MKTDVDYDVTPLYFDFREDDIYDKNVDKYGVIMAGIRLAVHIVYLEFPWLHYKQN